MNDLTMTIVGNLTDDATLRYTPTGVAVASFRIAHTPRIKDASGQWTDGETTYLDCQAWRDLAEHLAESLVKGSRAIVTGTLRTKRWTADGQDRSRLVLDVHAAGPELTYATAKITRLGRNGQTSEPDPWAHAA